MLHNSIYIPSFIKSKTITFALLCLFFMPLSAKNENTVEERKYTFIPQPNGLTSQTGHFILKGEITVSIPSEESFMHAFNQLKRVLDKTSVKLSTKSDEAKSPVSFVLDNNLPDEAYKLTVTSEKIEITANSAGSGLFYGVQSLLQLMPAEIYDEKTALSLHSILVPAVTINDAPRFPYRGAMMDVARNFLPKEEVLKFLDLMAAYKMNRFHFHLTDDQGWRIEIKKYPKLTEVGSYRSQTQLGHSDYYYPRRYDGIAKRGFYTQEEIKEIVKYAADRFIIVIPEIEMPGHSSASLASYPELSCGLGKAYVVRDYFDVFDEVYCTKENVFSFLEDVLTEVMELFPSHYIHIGGDECPKKAWKKCTHCQELMKKEELKSEEELQSWFIHRIERFVNSKGRDIIGWDEILEGGLAPNATVMSWRGETGGIIAARQGHNVIMTPGSKCYFDFYQEDPEFAPLAMGGFLPIDSVYNYNPIPSALLPEEQKYIIGTQANIWGEYIQTPEYFEYMAFPRLAAIAEVQWTNPENKDFEQFTYRLDNEFKKLDYLQVNACRNLYESNINGKWNVNKKRYEVSMNTFSLDTEIRYSLTDSVITPQSLLYTAPFPITKKTTLYAAVFRNKEQLAKTTRKTFTVNKATGSRYESNFSSTQESAEYRLALTDGLFGYPKNLRCWTVFEGDSVQIDLDLNKKQKIRKVIFSALWRPWKIIWPPKSVEISVSEDGWHFIPLKKESLLFDNNLNEGSRFPYSILLPKTKARFVRLNFQSFGVCPEGYFDENQPSKMAFDEIEVY